MQLQYGDTMTNIVVVQFSDYVQTGRDKRFNLTCLFRGPGEAVVTSGYIGAGYARSYRLRNRVLHPVHLIKQSDRRSTNLECKMYRIPLPHESWCKHTWLIYFNTSRVSSLKITWSCNPEFKYYLYRKFRKHHNWFVWNKWK